jgi:hypothetical protein
MRKQVGTVRGRPYARRAGTVLVAVAGAGLLTASAAGGTPAYLADGSVASAAGVYGQAAPQLAAAAAVGATVNCGGISVGVGAHGRPVADSERAGPAEAIAQVLRLAEWDRTSPYQHASWSLVQLSPDTAMLVAHLPGRTTYLPAYRRADGHWQMGAPCAT